MKKVLLFVATEKGYTALERLVTGKKREHVGCIVTFHEVNVDKDWSFDIFQLCQDNNIPCYHWGDAKNDLLDLIQQHAITGAIAISWRYMLPLELNSYLEDPLIVFHDSLLPKYRGFAPTPTAIICGEEVIGVSALFATNLVDQGDIILQKQMKVPHEMFMKEIIHDQSMLYADMVDEIVEQMIHSSLTATPQDETQATYSIWRNVEDCQIDWSKSSEELYNFIRALSSPYPGAFTYMDGHKIIIHRASSLLYDLNFAIRDIGKIWTIRDGMPEVVCGKGMLQIHEAVYEDGTPVPFAKLRYRLG